MLKNIVSATRKKDIEYELCFDDGHENGFGFPCDKSGKIKDISPEAVVNLAWCMEHPEKFVRFNKVAKYTRLYMVPGHGTCSCGAEVDLYDEYYGACQCPKCGQWYNLFGQELLPPDQWEKPTDE